MNELETPNSAHWCLLLLAHLDQCNPCIADLLVLTESGTWMLAKILVHVLF